MKSRLKNVSTEFHLNLVKSIFKRRLSNSKFFLPLTTTFFITMRCNLKCTYCRPILPNTKELPTDKVLQLIEKIRFKCPGLYISGGEPTLRNDLPIILKRGKELGFNPLWMITNALNIDQRLDCLQYLDYLVVSLDSLNVEKWERMLGVKGVAQKIIDNIIMVSKLQKKYDFTLCINNLINSETIPDFKDILEFCNEYDILLGPQPIDEWTTLGENLELNQDYVNLLNEIKIMKKNGEKRIIVTNVYLDSIMKSRYHTCYPTQNPRVYPDGSLLYPCTAYQKVYGNVLDYPDLYTMLKEAYKKQNLPECSKKSQKCMINCLIEPAILVDNPFRYATDVIESFSKK
jgi:MoaA/NifB/PqqE/SkfB family radical SAM enzyme